MKYFVICEYEGGSPFLLSLHGTEEVVMAKRAIAWQLAGQPVTDTTFHITKTGTQRGTFQTTDGRTFTPAQGCFTVQAWDAMLARYWPGV